MYISNSLLALTFICASTLAVAQSDLTSIPGAGRPDPDMQAVLDQLAKLNPKPIESLTAKEARKQPSVADAVMKEMKSKNVKPIMVGKIDNRSIDGPGGKIKIRVYSPKGDGPFPVIVYYHGGGFVVADLDTYDATPRELVDATHAIVVSAHYRQGPEHKFPAAHEDAFAAYRWVLDHAKELYGDPMRVAVAGESAGGNLAAAVAIMARDQKVQMPVYQLLIYPVANSDFNTPSYQENADAKPLSKPIMKWFFDNAADPSQANDPRLAILQTSDLKGLPPATVITAQIDPLRSEGKAYADKLKAAGVMVNYKNFDGVTHEFFGMGAVVGKAQEAVSFAGQGLGQAFMGRNVSSM